MGKKKQHGETIRDMNMPPNCSICKWCNVLTETCMAMGYMKTSDCYDTQACELLYVEHDE